LSKVQREMRLALALIVMLLAAFPALASPGCMTHSEAKHIYGRQTYLHWTGKHCWHAKRNETDNRRIRRQPDAVVPDKSPSRAAATLTGGSGLQSIWPDPPSDYSWTDRWPNQRVGEPERWLFDLMQFGSK
jgi:hypothetical protein